MPSGSPNQHSKDFGIVIYARSGLILGFLFHSQSLLASVHQQGMLIRHAAGHETNNLTENLPGRHEDPSPSA